MKDENETELPDFHSPEFNRVDDLNDWSGNYLSFESLEGVVTADMRHQSDLALQASTIDSSVDCREPSKKIDREKTSDEVIEATPLTVVSHGRTLIIGTDAERAIACARALRDRHMVCTVLITGSESTGTLFTAFNLLKPFEAYGVSVKGVFGDFSATATVKGDRRPLTKWLGDDAAVFDLVLDLQPTISYEGGYPPLGYYAPGSNPAALEEAMTEIPEMRGRFKKPRFMTFQGKYCLHGRSRARECRRCLDTCPFGAIQSVTGKIAINPYRCQGCGGCALICPAEAIEMTEPPLEALSNRLWSVLEAHRTSPVHPPTLVISDLTMTNSNELSQTVEKTNDHTVNFEVEQIAHAGLEMLLAALAYGAGNVLVACGSQNHPGIREAVERQVQMARAILQGLGLPQDACRFTVVKREDRASVEKIMDLTYLDWQTINVPEPMVQFPPEHSRRALVRLAVQHLRDQSGATDRLLPLPLGAPYGAVTVGPACTLCMACASACPTGALSAGGDWPRLQFRESQCCQCGLCEDACPEKAVQMRPRLLCDPAVVEVPLTLRETEPFRCIECDLPFATPAIINRMKEKLAGHWMYGNERQLRRIEMCATCRARDAFTSQDVKQWGH